MTSSSEWQTIKNEVVSNSLTYKKKVNAFMANTRHQRICTELQFLCNDIQKRQIHLAEFSSQLASLPLEVLMRPTHHRRQKAAIAAVLNALFENAAQIQAA